MTPQRWIGLELLCTVVLPTALLLGGADVLGPTLAVVLAVACPAAFVVASMAREGRPSGLALVALVSVLLSGGISLLPLDPGWFAVKEAAFPVGFGLLFAGSALTRRSLMAAVLERVVRPDRWSALASTPSDAQRLSGLLRRGSVELGVLTALSGGWAFALARLWVDAPAGTVARAEQLGDYTLGSFVLVTLPVMAGSMWVMARAFGAIEATFGVRLEDLLETTKPPPPAGDGGSEGLGR